MSKDKVEVLDEAGGRVEVKGLDVRRKAIGIASSVAQAVIRNKAKENKVEKLRQKAIKFNGNALQAIGMPSKNSIKKAKKAASRGANPMGKSATKKYANRAKITMH